MTAATVFVSAASTRLGAAPADVGLASAAPLGVAPRPAVVGPVEGHLPGQLLPEGQARGGTRLEVDWENPTPLQGQPVTIRGSAPVPKNGASRWAYLEEQAIDSGVWDTSRTRARTPPASSASSSP